MRIPASLRPQPTLTEQDVSGSLRMFVWEGVASGAQFSLGSGGFMAAYALALGANNLQVGLMAALPFLSQIAQIPAILAVERFRVRKALGVPALIVTHLMWLPIAAAPLLLETPGAAAVTAVIVLLGARGIIAAMWTVNWASWLRDLVPRNILGSYHGSRLRIITVVLAVTGLLGSAFVTWWEDRAGSGEEIYAYSILLAAGVLVFGAGSALTALRAREPLMPPVQEAEGSALSALVSPLRDHNFALLLRFLFVWSMISNFAIPFFAVYMLKDLGLTLTVVIGFIILSQFTNILFVRVWGGMADAVGSKTVLSLSASLYLLVILGFVFVAYPDQHALTYPLLAALFIFAGVAAAGVLLTVNTLALKQAPEGKATPFLGAASVATNVGTGIGPVLGGLAADFMQERSLTINVNWTSPGGILDLPAVTLAGYDFLFVITFILGLLSLNMLVALREEGELPREVAMGTLTANLSGVTRAVTAVPVLGPASAFSYGYLRRVPGADVALGVTAYQIAASAQMAVASAARSRGLARDVSGAVLGVIGQALGEVEDIATQGREVARHAVRGAVQAGDDVSGQMGDLARGAFLGVLRAMPREAPVLDVIRGAAYGMVQGALEAGEDPTIAILEAREAAREASRELGAPEAAAARAFEAGVRDAAADAGAEAQESIEEALQPGS